VPFVPPTRGQYRVKTPVTAERAPEPLKSGTPLLAARHRLDPVSRIPNPVHLAVPLVTRASVARDEAGVFLAARPRLNPVRGGDAIPGYPPISLAGFVRGARVIHQKFGKGVIKNTTQTGAPSQLQCDVLFDNNIVRVISTGYLRLLP
jgi:hypothetical protein